MKFFFKYPSSAYVSCTLRYHISSVRCHRDKSAVNCWSNLKTTNKDIENLSNNSIIIIFIIRIFHSVLSSSSSFCLRSYRIVSSLFFVYNIDMVDAWLNSKSENYHIFHWKILFSFVFFFFSWNDAFIGLFWFRLSVRLMLNIGNTQTVLFIICIVGLWTMG